MAFDLDKVIAERPKSRKKPFEFTFDGKRYTLSPERDAIALRAASEGDNMMAFRRLIGPAQFAEIQASPKMLLPADLIALMLAYYDEVYGVAAGKSSASPKSSRRTGRPSKRTSQASTRARGSRT